jgi:hypothetical protein
MKAHSSKLIAQRKKEKVKGRKEKRHTSIE